jgi:SLT domain-containing protein
VRGITQLAFSGFSAPAQGAGTFTFSGESARHGAVFSGSYLPMRAFSEGGISRRPTIGMISEGGKPEAVIPLSRGREIPVRLDGGNNIGSPIVVFNVSANDAASFNQQLLRQETRRTIQAIMEEGFAANRRLSARGRRL